MMGKKPPHTTSDSKRWPRASAPDMLSDSIMVLVCDTMTPLGVEEVPDVNRICQMSSPWIFTSGSLAAAPLTKS